MGADAVRGDRRVPVRDLGAVRGHVQVLCAGDADLGSVRAGHGDRRQGQDARRRGRPGRQRSTAAKDRCQAEAGDRSRPDQVHPGQRGGADRGHHRLRRQVRRPGLSREPEPATAGSRRGAAFAECQHRGQHGLRKRRRRAQKDRSSEAERGADRAGRRRCAARASGSARPPPTPTRC